MLFPVVSGKGEYEDGSIREREGERQKESSTPPEANHHHRDTLRPHQHTTTAHTHTHTLIPVALYKGLNCCYCCCCLWCNDESMTINADCIVACVSRAYFFGRPFSFPVGSSSPARPREGAFLLTLAYWIHCCECMCWLLVATLLVLLLLLLLLLRLLLLLLRWVRPS